MDELTELLGESQPMETVRNTLLRLLARQRTAQRFPALLLQGETGTGKGLVARLLHRYSARRAAPFIDVNCAAIPDNLLEAELFGFERGAFTDARRAKPGLFQAAHGGVLFLDEVGLLPDSAQAKLLKALEEGAVRRLGSTRPEPVDIWLISATNTHLLEAVRARRFREDLYHRLAVLTLELPPLRERGRDILMLAERFLTRACAEYGLPPRRLEAAAQARLLEYAWPGNVRELGNVIERAALFADAPVLTRDSLGPLEEERAEAGAPAPASPGASYRDEVLRDQLLAALNHTAWNVSLTAARLGVSRTTVYARIERLGLRAKAPRRTVSSTVTPEPVPLSAATSALEWEKKRLTLLRAELPRFDDGEASSRASRTLDAAIAKVHGFGGRIEELTPTGLVAAFGLEPTEDAPRRAAHAALAIQKEAHRGDNGDGTPIEFAIALHEAAFLIGRAGPFVEIDAAAKRAECSSLDALLRASAPGETVASPAVAPFLERRFELVSVARSAESQGAVYRLTGQERRGLELWGALTPFVGRVRELEFLRDRLIAAAKGRGQALAVVGEAGVGKSRLLYELAPARRLEGWRVLETSGVSYGQTMSYLPIIGLLKGYFGIHDRDDAAMIREKVTGSLSTLDTALEPTIPALLALLDVAIDDTTWRGLDPQQRRQRTLEAITGLIAREARIQPMLLIVEDLHWIDGETQALLDLLVDTVGSARVLLLVSFRPEYKRTWGHSQLRLDTLAHDGARELLDGLLGDDPGLEPVKQSLVKRGNPFFIEETVRTLVETRALAGERGAYQVVHPIPATEVPSTVEAVLAARIGRLAPEDRRLLEIAAVIGKDVPVALLQAVTGKEEKTLWESLARLQAAEFVYKAALSPGPEFTFKHALTHEVAYAALLPEARRAMHARIVDAIERLHQDRLAEQTERLAHHSMHGGLREKAVPYLRQAGLKAAARSALPEARAWFERTLDVLAVLTQDRSTMEQGFDIRLELRPILSQLGEIRRVQERLCEAQSLAERLDDDQRRGRVCALLTNVHSLLGEFDEALASGTQALQIARRLPDLKLRILTTTYLEQEYYYRAEYERVEELGTENLAVLPPGAVFETFGATLPISIYDRYWVVRSLAELGRFADAAAYAAEARRLADLTHHAYAVGMSYEAGTWLYLLKGDWVTARALNERGLTAARMANVILSLPVAVAGSAWVLAQGGEASEALARVREGERLIDHDALRGSILRGRVYYALGRACLLIGRFDEARSLSERVLRGESSYSRPRPGFVAHALHLLGDIATHPDRLDPECAESHYREALAIAEPRGMRPLVAHCHLGLGKLYRHTLRQERAQEHLTIATRMYRDMDMQFWLEQTESQAGRW